jgi:hypothetical protein
MGFGAVIVQEVTDGSHGCCGGSGEAGRNGAEDHDEGGIHRASILDQSTDNALCSCYFGCRGGRAVIREGGILYALSICWFRPYVRVILGELGRRMLIFMEH